jgi:uncharacterized protein DUF2683
METIIHHPKTKEQLKLFEQLANALKVPFEKNREADAHYNPEFVAKIQRSRKNYDEGKGVEVTIKELKQLLCK